MAGVDFAAFNIFLNERRAVEFLVDVVDALHQLLHAFDDGAAVDADGSVFRDRLDDQRKLDVVRVLGAAFVGDGEVRSLDLVKVENLFRDRLVLRQVESLWAAAGIGNVQQFQIGGDVLVHGVVAGVGLREVEDEVGAALCQRQQRLVLAVQNVIGRLVPELCQRLEDLFAVVQRIFLLPCGACHSCRAAPWPAPAQARAGPLPRRRARWLL